MHSADKILESSNLKSKAENSAMVKSKRKKFFDLYLHQNFSFPSDSIIYYIAKNPTSPELYQKIIQTCKYFFIKHPILVIAQYYYFYDYKGQLSCTCDLSKITSQFWITDRLVVQPKSTVNQKVVNQNLISSVMPKLFQCDAEIIDINNQIISFQDLSLLISSAEKIFIHNTTVKDKNGLYVAVEKIVEVAVKAKWIEIQSDESHLIVTSKTMKELIKIPHFSKLDGLTLIGIPEVFDLETFYAYMKKNKTTKVWLRFHNSVSDAYKNRLEEIVDEILTTETRNYKPPFICFLGLDIQKYSKLQRIYWSQ